MKNIFVNIQSKGKMHNYITDSYLDLIKKYNIKVFLFSDDYLEEDFNRKKELAKKNIYLEMYNSKEDLINQIKTLKEEYNIKYINTFIENLIILTNEVKLALGQKVTDNFELFRNKKIQRELLLEYNKDITVNYLEIKIGNLDFKELKKQFGIPFMLKPKDGVESSGVAKILNSEDLKKYKESNDLTKKILAEEFIDGEMYSIDYFVNSKQEIFISKPIKIEFANKLGINDFFNYSRIISKEVEKELENINLKEFIKENVIGAKIKNTFIHHEFKLTSKNQLKTIELNGRIGGYRLEMYKESNGINLLEIVLNSKSFEQKTNINFAIIAIYGTKKGVLKSYNYELLEKIKKLKSFHSLRILPEKYEGKEIGLTKDGFGKVGTIKLKNKELKQFKKDFNFIENNYKKILIIN